MYTYNFVCVIHLTGKRGLSRKELNLEILKSSDCPPFRYVTFHRLSTYNFSTASSRHSNICPFSGSLYVHLYGIPQPEQYRGADKTLARPGRKQANISLRMVWISFGDLPRKKRTWWQLASRCCWNRARPWYASELVSFLVGLRTYQHPVSRWDSIPYL